MRRLLAAILWLLPGPLYAQAGPNDLYMRIVDVGGGLCTVTKVPPEYYIVYDAGHWVGKHCIKAVREIVDGEKIHLMVISHSDADHLGDAAEILNEYDVQHIVRTGSMRFDSATWRKFNDAVAEEVKTGATVRDFSTYPLEPGWKLQFGAATLTFIAGWNDWPQPGPTPSERRNAVSIVAKLEYGGSSILLTGDTVGRRKGDPNNACKDAEKWMVDSHPTLLKADIIIAPHHGGDNGSAKCFIEKVNPSHVVFSAGHAHEHPTRAAAERYLAHGIPRNQIFRTDRGDNEGGFEWPELGQTCKDKAGDDDIDIVLSQNGSMTVAHRIASSGC